MIMFVSGYIRAKKNSTENPTEVDAHIFVWKNQSYNL